jgi:hypothetical protein
LIKAVDDGIRPQRADKRGIGAATGGRQGHLVVWKPSRSYLQILHDNAVTPVNPVLLIICGVLFGLGLYGDAFMTGGLALGKVAVAVFQEARAKRQLDRLQSGQCMW